MAKVLLSTIGTRGEVQPILALALELKGRGQDAAVCVPPDFKEWGESYGISCTPIGPPLKGFSLRAPSGKRMKLTRARAKEMVAASVRSQFQVLGAAAQGADLLVAAGALQTAARSIADLKKIPYVYASYCAGTLPSSDHPPWRVRSQTWPRWINSLIWKFSDRMSNTLFREPVNAERAALGCAPIKDVYSHVFTDRPWLAADTAVGPAGSSRAMKIFQTGAWFLRDSSPLPEALEKFLASGEPPVYFGFGSTSAPDLKASELLAAARKIGRRVILSQGWANLKAAEAGSDCISIGDVAHEKLFPRVAAIVHHGGAGTTTTAARAGRPQVIVPHVYDQFYWAHRVEKLGVGARLRKLSESLSDQLADALRNCLEPEVEVRAQALATRVEQHGASIAAEKLIAEYL
jgi:vancomycin aglycone glucosyltransferase